MNIMKAQMDLEETFTDLALDQEKPTIILCDRGCMDGQAYNDQKIWDMLTEKTGLTNIMLRDTRYDAVIHMVTCADGAVEFYDQLTNEARYESAAEAVETDHRLIKAWIAHPNFHIINNKEPGFQNKIDRVTDTILSLVGLPTQKKLRKKFLLKS